MLPFVTDSLAFPLFLLPLTFASLASATDFPAFPLFLFPQTFVSLASATDFITFRPFLLSQTFVRLVPATDSLVFLTFLLLPTFESLASGFHPLLSTQAPLLRHQILYKILDLNDRDTYPHHITCLFSQNHRKAVGIARYATAFSCTL